MPRVELYTTPSCPFCVRAKRLLAERHIAYTEFDIEKSAEGRRRYEALGGSGVPVLTVNGTVIHGYNPDAILDALR